MSASDITHYVITFRFTTNALTHLLTFSSALVSAGFSTTYNDADGHPHELGTNNFGLITALSPEDLHQQALSVGEQLLGQQPEVKVQTLEAFLKQDQS